MVYIIIGQFSNGLPEGTVLFIAISELCMNNRIRFIKYENTRKNIMYMLYNVIIRGVVINVAQKRIFSNQSRLRDNFYPAWYMQARNAIYYILGIIEVLLAFRFFFKLLGASLASGFVSFIYSITGILVAPFAGIFSSFVTRGGTVTSVFEPADLIAMIVYAVIARGLVGLVKLRANDRAI